MALLTNEQRIISQVTGGAATIWMGRPLKGMRLRKGDAAQLAPLLFIVPFFVFWESGALQIPKDTVMGFVFPLFGFVVFSLILWQTCGSLLYNIFVRNRTYYALTADGFAVVAVDGHGRSTRRIYLPALTTIDFDPAPDGSGTIWFGPSGKPAWLSRNGYADTRPPSFDCVANAAAVYALCAKLQKGSRE